MKLIRKNIATKEVSIDNVCQGCVLNYNNKLRDIYIKRTQTCLSFIQDGKSCLASLDEYGTVFIWIKPLGLNKNIIIL